MMNTQSVKRSETTWKNVNVGTSCSYTIAGLDMDVEYDVQVKAIGDGVNYKSVYSAILRVNTDSAINRDYTDSTSTAALDLGADLFDELAEEVYDSLTEHFVPQRRRAFPR